MVPTGGINVKGKGMMDTYLWERPPGSADDDLVSVSALCTGGGSIANPSSRMRQLLLLHPGRMSVSSLHPKTNDQSEAARFVSESQAGFVPSESPPRFLSESFLSAGQWGAARESFLSTGY